MSGPMRFRPATPRPTRRLTSGPTLRQRPRRGLGALLALALGLGLAPTAWAESPLPERRVVLQADMDLPGGDLAPIFQTTADACVQLCLANPDCQALTYNARSRACFPKAAAGAPAPFVGAQSGQVLATDPAALAAVAARTEGTAGWLRPDDLTAARRQAEGLGTLYPGSGEPLDVLRG